MTTYTVYDTQDTAWYRDGLTNIEADALCTERNANNSRFGDRYAVLEDAIFVAATRRMGEDRA